MNQRGRRYQRVAFGPRVGDVKSRTALRHCRIDRQNRTFKSSEDLMVNPSAPHSTLRRVLTHDQQRAKFDFENRDRRYEEARCGERVRPASDIAISFVRLSQVAFVSSRNINRDRSRCRRAAE
jgi:hypothetical protein